MSDLYMFESREREGEKPDQGDKDFWVVQARILHLAEAVRVKANFRERDVDGVELARFATAAEAEVVMQQLMDLESGNLDLTVK